MRRIALAVAGTALAVAAWLWLTPADTPPASQAKTDAAKQAAVAAPTRPKGDISSRGAGAEPKARADLHQTPDGPVRPRAGPARAPQVIVHDLEQLVARRQEFSNARDYWARFERLKREFAASGEASAPLLEDHLIDRSAHPRLRRASAALLGVIRAERSLPLLVDTLREDGDDGVRRVAARALAAYRPSEQARQALIQELLAGRPFGGSYAVVFSLSEFRNPEDIQLFKYLATSHEDVSVRMQSVHALGQYQDPEVIPFLASVAARDPHPDPRLMAEQVLEDLRR